MVAERVLGSLVDAEAVVGVVVSMCYRSTCPRTLTLDAEVVVRHAREVAIAVARLEDSLTHGDACGNAVCLHVVHGHMTPFVDILLGR